MIPGAQTLEYELRQCWSNDLPERPDMITCARMSTRVDLLQNLDKVGSTAVRDDVSAEHYRVV